MKRPEHWPLVRTAQHMRGDPHDVSTGLNRGGGLLMLRGKNGPDFFLFF